MKKFYLIPVFLFVIIFSAQSQKPEDSEVWEPEPKIITPGYSYSSAPSDAIVLFSENSLDQWTGDDGNEAPWIVEGRQFTVKPKSGGIKTKKEFNDFQLHIEWRPPLVVSGEGQGRGNSGIFLQGKYELQVLDSYQNRTYSNGQAASMYKQHIPLVNAMHRTGVWNSYDVIYTAPRFTNGGDLESPAYVTVFHNGVLVQNHVAIKGGTVFIGKPSYEAHGAGPILLQDHGNPVSFRNIWIREL